VDYGGLISDGADSEESILVNSEMTHVTILKGTKVFPTSVQPGLFCNQDCYEPIYLNVIRATLYQSSRKKDQTTTPLHQRH
jgi:hypothetical protein